MFFDEFVMCYGICILCTMIMISYTSKKIMQKHTKVWLCMIIMF